MSTDPLDGGLLGADVLLCVGANERELQTTVFIDGMPAVDVDPAVLADLPVAVLVGPAVPMRRYLSGEVPFREVSAEIRLVNGDVQAMMILTGIVQRQRREGPATGISWFFPAI